MDRKNITDIFFDLDHTLWDFDKNSSLAFARVFSKHKVTIDLIEFLKIYEPINLEYWKKYREEKVTKEELRRGRLNDAFAMFQLTFPEEYIDGMAVSYIDELPVDNYLLDNAVAILEYLQKNYRLHIITNGFREVQNLKLKNSGIEKFFTTVTSSEEVGVKKPNPLVFSSALKKADTSAEKSMMIGDSFEADILGAEAAGMHTLFFNYRKEIFDPAYATVNHLSEIKNYL
ncbi:YjjG family noncanonical pyrimidine nucleotidase [Aequorivita echinoideorum]|uniref:YjjG family noncanonical pyrimidine nucleotidase n=1 Tax=Aequorivita echinoideorum TaxID=1549647 RepID=A0ABS5S081_9FLAO|nr:YjjG family noncanonical pyrimidine nucleotidase [Aequorivita echinoideorum]MBT0606611.1 YjjG family noncanonical pyrimidine nucleotidase [Aequorivita echinoideorum]